MKKKLLKTGAVIMALCTLCGASSLSSFAASSENTQLAKTVYYKEGDQNTGIKSVEYDGTLFYDCVNNTETKLNSQSIRKILTTPVTYEDANGNTGTITPLDQWANVASSVFENGGKYTCTTDYSKYYGSNYKYTSAEDVNVAGALAEDSSVSNGKQKKDNYYSTGLSQTNSLSELRNEMCKQISNRINRYSLDWTDILGQGDYNPDALPELADTTQRDVYYNIVTSIIQEGSTCKYQYNSYGVALYDFDLKIIDPDGIEYVQDKAKTKTESSEISTVIRSTKNETKYDTSDTVSTQISSSESISTSVSNSTGYSLSELFGGSVELSNAFLKGTLKTEITASQIFESARTNETTTVSSVTNTGTASYTVPAHTIVDVVQSVSKESMTVSYDLPVALTYKVAVFSMSGDVYADSAWTLCISTAGYEQSNFSTFFGSDTTTEGLYATQALNNRLENANCTGWDASYGNNHVFYKYHDGSSNPTDTTNYNLNWNNISSTFDKLTSTANGIKDFASKCPMLSAGATTTTVCDGIDTKISDPQSMYLPKYFRVANSENLWNSNELYTGGTFELNKLSIGAFDKDNVPYYGFKATDGYWSVKEGSEDVIAYDPATYTVIAKGVGTGTLVWQLKDGVKYTAAYENGTVTNENATPIEVSFTVREYTF